MSIINRDTFCDIMKHIENSDMFADEVDAISRKYNSNPFISGLCFRDLKMEDMLINTLSVMFDCGDIIEWWIQDAKFGKDPDSWVEENGVRTYLYTAEDLYGYIVKGKK